MVELFDHLIFISAHGNLLHERVDSCEPDTFWCDHSANYIVKILTQQSDSQTAHKYWNELKQRPGKEGSQLVTNCNRLKMIAIDGKQQFKKEDSQSVRNCHRLKSTVIDGKNTLPFDNKKRIKKTKGNAK